LSQDEKPTPDQLYAMEVVLAWADQAAATAKALGVVLTIEQCPLKPLAMGNHETVVSVRPARKMAEAS
jgi:hypothetical protein